MSASQFLYGETELAEALGLPIRLLQKNRSKKRSAGADWALNANHVAYTTAGVGRAVQLLGPDLDGQIVDLEILLDKCRLRANGEAPEIKAIVARFFANPHLVELRLPDQTSCHVRVQTTRNLRPGMELRVTGTPATGFELAQRLPRSVREGRNHARRA